MKSIVTTAPLSLDVPRLLVAAAQPYQTVAGPALTTNFAFLPHLLPFQKLPFSNSMIAPLYYHTLLHTLAEFAETPRPTRHSHVRQRHAPKEDLWRSVGTLNTFYHTMYPIAAPVADPHTHHHSYASSLFTSATHPAMGAVELVRASHRQEHDVRLTLYDENHKPISAMLMTGPSERIHSIETEGGPGTSVRHALPPLPPPAPADSGEDHSERGETSVYVHVSGPLAAHGGLYGDVVLLDGQKSWAHRACFQPGAEVSDAVAGPVPPWLLYQLIVDLTARLFELAAAGDASVTGIGLESLVPVLGVGSAVQWVLCAQQAVLTGDIVFGEPLELVCAAPRVSLDYRLPPWKHVIGQPALRGGSPCVAMRVEVRQGHTVAMTGTFFLVPVVAPRADAA